MDMNKIAVLGLILLTLVTPIRASEYEPLVLETDDINWQPLEDYSEMTLSLETKQSIVNEMNRRQQSILIW